MDFEAVGNSCLFWGGVWVGVGAISVSGGWFLLGIYQQANNWLRKRRRFKVAVLRRGSILLAWVILVLGGSFLIGKGSTLTTKGWNILDNHSQKQALIVAAIREWKLNDDLLPLCHFEETDESVLAERWQYPRFEWNASSTLYSSPLFNVNHSGDSELLKSARNYLFVVRVVQEELDVVDGKLHAALTASKPLEYHRVTNTSKDIKIFLAVHRGLGKLLEEKYPENWRKALRTPEE
ncbi:MAG: hypothetical protein JW720_01730 [Sedimentisphaerales bacterium]|nr:hypothetical protein [Sedimentisphaerales bacterium]